MVFWWLVVAHDAYWWLWLANLLLIDQFKVLILEFVGNIVLNLLAFVFIWYLKDIHIAGCLLEKRTLGKCLKKFIKLRERSWNVTTWMSYSLSWATFLVIFSFTCIALNNDFFFPRIDLQSLTTFCSNMCYCLFCLKINSWLILTHSLYRISSAEQWKGLCIDWCHSSSKRPACSGRLSQKG